MGLSPKIIMYIIIAILIVIILYVIYSKVKNKIQLSQAKNSYESSFITGKIGDSTYSFNARLIAETVYNAMHEDCMYGACEYDEKAVEALLPVPKQFIPQVVDEYAKIKNKKLVMPLDLENLMDGDNWNKIKYLFQ